MLGPLWPTSLAIAPAALAARAAGTMPGGYCHYSGTWGSPDDAKWDQHPWFPRKARKTQSLDRRWATPSSHEDIQGTTGPQKGSGLPPGPTSLWDIAQDKEAPRFRGPAGGRTTPEGLARTEEDNNANAGARRQKTWAPRRRTGPRSWSVGVSAHYLHLS